MKKICFVFLFFGCQLKVQAQNCPSSISVSAPSSEVLTGTTFQFSVNISGLPANISPTYNWMISSGTIVSGQGTSMITVDPGTEPGYCTATVELGGLPAPCNRTASATADIRKGPEKIVSTTIVTAAGIQSAVKKFISKTDFKNVTITQSVFVNIYSINGQQFIKLKAMVEKAFEANGIFSYQYTIANAGQGKAAIVDMLLYKTPY